MNLKTFSIIVLIYLTIGFILHRFLFKEKTAKEFATESWDLGVCLLAWPTVLFIAVGLTVYDLYKEWRR